MEASKNSPIEVKREFPVSRERLYRAWDASLASGSYELAVSFEGEGEHSTLKVVQKSNDDQEGVFPIERAGRMRWMTFSPF